MYMAYNISNGKHKDFFVDKEIFPFIKDTIRTRAHYVGINVIKILKFLIRLSKMTSKLSISKTEVFAAVLSKTPTIVEE